MAGATCPTRSKHRAVLPMEGRSLVPAFDNHPIEQVVLFWEHVRNAAGRVGDWKLVRVADKPGERLDLSANRSGLHDLAAKEPDRADRWKAWADRAHVHPKTKK